MKTKKAHYISLLVLVVLVAVGFLVINLNKKFTTFTEGIGDYQKAVFKTSNDMFLLEEFLSQSAYFAFDMSVTDFTKTDLRSEQCEINKIECTEHSTNYCYVLNTQENINTCMPNFYNSFQNLFYQNFNGYITKYNTLQDIFVPFDFEFSVLNETTFSVINAQPVIMPIIVNTFKAGEAMFRPAFKVNNPNTKFLYDLKELFEKMKKLPEQCSSKSTKKETQNCITQILGDTLKYTISTDEKQHNNKLYLINLNYPDFCLGINLPLKYVQPIT